MEWFKHSTGSHDDPDISDAEDIFGDAGYTFFFKILEIYGQEFAHLDDGWLDVSQAFVRRKLHKTWTNVRRLLDFYQTKKRICFTASNGRVRIKIPKFIDLASNWTVRKRASPTEAPTEAPTAIEQNRSRTEVDCEGNKTKLVKDLKDQTKQDQNPFPLQTQNSNQPIRSKTKSKAKAEITERGQNLLERFLSIYPEEYLELYPETDTDEILSTISSLNPSDENSFFQSTQTYRKLWDRDALSKPVIDPINWIIYGKWLNFKTKNDGYPEV